MADVTKVKASDGTIYDINDVNDYTKDETDALLAGKADVGDSYTKAEADALLADKANASDVTSELALKANVVDVYSKTEADNLLAGKADVGVSYTKAEDDALLAGKADAADVYTITQTDGLLADKAGIDDSSTTATMATWSASKLNVEFQGKADDSDVYTKAEVDALIGGVKMYANLDWGNPVHCFAATPIPGDTSVTSGLTFTATEDCYLYGWCGKPGINGSFTVTVNTTPIWGAYEGSAVSDSPSVATPMLLKLGDIVTTNTDMPRLHIFKERS